MAILGIIVFAASILFLGHSMKRVNPKDTDLPISQLPKGFWMLRVLIFAEAAFLGWGIRLIVIGAL